MFSWVFSFSGWVEFCTLLVLEIILGIDNVIFLSLCVNNLAKHQRARARFFGLALAMLARLALLASIFWLSKLTAPLFTLLGNEISGRDLVLILGGAFLVAKSTKELASTLKSQPEQAHFRPAASFFFVLIEIALIDIIFSLDSVITAVGIAQELSIMMLAVIFAVIFMMFASKMISDVIEKYSELKIIALAFLVLVGAVLVAEGLEWHVEKGYIYSALGFSLAVALLKIISERAKN